MSEAREKNPIKQMAKYLVFQMEDEQRIYEDNTPPWRAEEILEGGKLLRDEILKKGYDINLLLHYGEEYKTLSWAEHKIWIYE